jgi:iron complex transport system ATP-binding protein
METILQAKNLNVGYDKKIVISDINLNAFKGQVICLLGSNGAGKSTILRTLSGLLAPVSGAVEIDGESISAIKKKELARKLSLVLTEQIAPAMTTVNALVSMGRTPYTDFMGRLSEEDYKIIDEALETVGADNLRDRFFSELSDGEKQKVMIARALVQEPELIILDEPTSHLDIRHKIEVVRILQKLSNEKNITCILSLHDIDLAIKGCQTVMLVNGGKIVDFGTPEEIIKSGVIQKLYNIDGAEYNELMGSVELKGADRKDVFVVSGNGTGINICRSLARNGYGITSGVLHENDRDYDVAVRICSKIVSEKAFESISDEHLKEAEELAFSNECAVDSGFPVGTLNTGNIVLLKSLLSTGRTVYSLRSPEESRELFGGLSGNIIHVGNTVDLLNKIKH